MLISLLGYAGRVSGQESVTITQCYEWARANYPQIHQMGLIDQTERYSLSNVGKAWLPQLSVSGKASYQSDVTKLPLDGDKISSLLPGFEIPSLSKDQYQVVAQVDQTIWDGGKSAADKRIAEAEAAEQRQATDVDLYALEGRVDDLYFGILLLDERVAQTKLTLGLLRNNLDKVRSLQRNGAAMQSDADAVEAELLTVEQQLAQVEASRESYRRMLDEKLAAHSLEIQPVFVSGNAGLIASLVEQNAGLALLPDYITKPYIENGALCYLNVPEMEIEIWTQLLHHREKWVSEPMRIVIDHLRRCML